MSKKIAFLTAGGIAPCLSSSIGALIEQYNQLMPDAELSGYLNGYQGLLTGKSIPIGDEVKKNYQTLFEFGGSAIGNSRVKLTNVEDCTKRGLVKEGENPLHVAAEQLKLDDIDILHTIGGDDTNTTAADLAKYLEDNGYGLTVVGLPKTIDNDVFPISQTLGAWTAAEQSALFFENVANENTTSTRQLIIHEVMGRHCGWLTAAAASDYMKSLDGYNWLPEINICRERWNVHAVWVPEMELDLNSELSRLNEQMDKHDSVNLFLSEGAGTDAIIKEKEAAGEELRRDAFGHVRLDELNPGKWFAKYFKTKLLADKVLVQKSGYFARSSSPNKEDLELIFKLCDFAVESAILENNGVIGEDIENENKLTCIDFNRIRGNRPFKISSKWFKEMSQDFES